MTTEDEGMIQPRDWNVGSTVYEMKEEINELKRKIRPNKDDYGNYYSAENYVGKSWGDLVIELERTKATVNRLKDESSMQEIIDTQRKEIQRLKSLLKDKSQ